MQYFMRPENCRCADRIYGRLVVVVLLLSSLLWSGKMLYIYMCVIPTPDNTEPSKMLRLLPWPEMAQAASFIIFSYPSSFPNRLVNVLCGLYNASHVILSSEWIKKIVKFIWKAWLFFYSYLNSMDITDMYYYMIFLRLSFNIVMVWVSKILGTTNA